MIKGAIFDMDGLLFDTEIIYQRIWKELAAENGVHLDSFFTRRIAGTSGKAAAKVLEEYFHTDDTAPLTSECALRMKESTKKHIAIKPGVMEMIEYLGTKDVRMIVASGSFPEQIRQNLRVTGLGDQFDEIVSGTEVEYGKPRPDIFLRAAELLGVAPERALVLEDSYNGVRAAHAGGIPVIMVPDLLPPTEEMREKAAAVMESLDDVRLALLKTLPEPQC